jgi:hypothetical protein
MSKGVVGDDGEDDDDFDDDDDDDDDEDDDEDGDDDEEDFDVVDLDFGDLDSFDDGGDDADSMDTQHSYDTDDSDNGGGITIEIIIPARDLFGPGDGRESEHDKQLRGLIERMNQAGRSASAHAAMSQIDDLTSDLAQTVDNTNPTSARELLLSEDLFQGGNAAEFLYESTENPVMSVIGTLSGSSSSSSNILKPGSKSGPPDGDDDDGDVGSSGGSKVHSDVDMVPLCPVDKEPTK